MGTPRRRPRAILKDSLSNLVPKEGTGRAPRRAPRRAPSDALDSEEELTTDRPLF